MKTYNGSVRVLKFSLSLVFVGSVLCGCGKNSEQLNATDSGGTLTPATPAAVGGRSAQNPRVNPAACDSYIAGPNDSQAFSDIAKLSKKQCQDNYQQLVNFYIATKDMTDAERVEFFQSSTSAVQPPPPAPCSVITQKLLACAQQ
jgi:hypothetical protein